MTIEAESKFVDVNRLQLRYLDWGNAGAPWIVCLHGYTGSAEAFNVLAERYRDRFHIVALDARGHGTSAWASHYSDEERAADVDAFLDTLGIDRCTLIGTSMGGLGAMAFMRLRPDVVDRLVINDIGPDTESGVMRVTQTVAARPDSFATIDEAIAWRATVNPMVGRRTPEDQRDLALGTLKQREDGRWVPRMDPAYVSMTMQPGYIEGVTETRKALWPVLAGVKCPTLVVWGTESDVLSEAQAQRMVATIPNAQLVRVPGASHAPVLNEPEVLAALDHFLRTE